MLFFGTELEKDDYCSCGQRSVITSREDEFGYWDICCNCKKPIEYGFHYYNYHDGEDHDDIDIWH